MVPPPLDRTEGFLGAVDRKLTQQGQNPLEIIPEEARKLLISIRYALGGAIRAFEETGKFVPAPADLARGVVWECAKYGIQGVEFKPGDKVNGEHIGFFVVPGVKQIEGQGTHNLVVAYIDWERATEEELKGIEHFHVGTEVADVWDGQLNGLMWKDAQGNSQFHWPEDGIREMSHGSFDGYSGATEIRSSKPYSQWPSYYFGPYYGRISKKEPGNK